MIKKLDAAIDKIDSATLAHDKPSKEQVISIIQILLELYLVFLKWRLKVTTKEVRRAKILRQIMWIETGTFITTLIK